ncbi:3-hydroxyacyl-CoA dehydrogenase family protein [Metabacillus litoralis]|uniref:3-hydroxyacyl-CoA dehydrogenase family protein n=1 Tax=Metabacillus litoralis TaxID=152268 RepID=A0A5C6W4K6_9BACI|nr:3-hydroxyacyl-CoA dehydrogenase family protein [Metabacillus litoralis]TXC91476.1 3-hydroxyacyl-CoA dehydrogenase family protein [Metabacillus litoralis]
MSIQTVCVVGAGQMGHQIAMLSALAGFKTILQDLNEVALDKAKSNLQTLMERWVAKGKITEEFKDASFNNLTFSTNIKTSASEADFIIEAIVEKLDAKQELFKILDKYAKPTTILASNSSTIVNSLLAEVTNRPDKVINMHFFFPPLVMDCIEVVKSESTSEKTVQLTMDVSKKMNRTAVLLQKEISGFIANRILGALQREAVYLYENGYADFKDIDLICKKALHHPIGPFELMDLSGIDVGYYVMQQRFAETGDLLDKPSRCIEEKVEQGHLGRKTGKGWYLYNKEEIKN